MIDCVYSVYDTSLKNVQLALPNKLYEAIKCNLPIIVAKNTKLSDIVKEWGVGMEVSDNDENELLQAIIRLKNDKEYYNTIINNCNKMNDIINCKEINNLYMEILNKYL